MERVHVPVDLLLDPTITASAKVVWMALRLYPELTDGRHPSNRSSGGASGCSSGCSLGRPPELRPEHPPGRSTSGSSDRPSERPPGRPTARSLGRPSPTRLAALTGLSRPTVRKALARLADAGWYRLSPPSTVLPRTQSKTRRFVAIPRELLEDRTVRPQAVVMYGVLQATPGFRPPTGKYTRKQLREMTGRALKTIRRATNMLAARGWLALTRKNHLCPFVFTVKNPVLEACLEELERLKRRIDRGKHKGEGLMRAYLTFIVDSVEFEDDASPGFLVNPFTDERMQLDRFYPGKVAFEFNGPQHYGPTDFATPRDVERQRARDHIKAGICRDRGIPLVVVHPEDLTLETMIRKVGAYLPLRDLRNRGPIVRYLERVSHGYRREALRDRALAAKQAANAGS